MKKNRTISRWIFPLIFIFVLLAVEFWAQEEVVCPQDTRLFSESFDNTAWMDPISSVDNWGAGFVTLNKLGSNFDVANPEYIPVWINTISTDDFDNDGWPDFVASSSDYSNVLAFVRNMGADDPDLIGTFDITHWIDGSDGDAADNPTAGVGGAAIDEGGHCGLVSGDWDDDGDIDFLFVASNGDSPYSPKRIWLYENELEDTGNLGFNQVDKTSDWADEIKGIAWSATAMVSLDFDGDGDIDILVGNSEGEVILIKSRSLKKSIDDKNKWVIEQVLDTGWAERGVSTLSVADFDADGDLDIIVGSVSYPELRYYKNDGSGNFSLYTTYGSAYFDGAATVAICEDFDADGDPDIMIGTDNWNYSPGGPIGGQCYYFKNAGGDFSVAWNFDGRPYGVYDFDLGASFDFDQDGDQDFLIADGNHTENYYLFINNLADVYNLEGTAQSINISPELDPELHSITKVQFTRLIQDVVGGSSEGLAIDYYVSNNDGRNWEFYTRFADSQIGTASDMPVHTFKHYGTKLKWKAILTAEDDEIPAYPNSSWETPLIDQLDLEYTFVERREYSRTSVATSVLTDEGNIKLIIGGTFYFPGWQGHLRAYDMTNLAPLNSSYTELRTISRSDLF